MSAGAPEWVSAERHPTLLEEEKVESAETRGSDGAGALVERLKRRGGEAISAGRRDMCARIEDALRASTVVQYNMSAFSSPVFPTYYRSVRKRRGRGGTAPSLSRADGVIGAHWRSTRRTIRETKMCPRYNIYTLWYTLW